ncbi:MAG: ATP-dependent DNA helicase RecG, partial [Treponema sp.]|nr:ATP-dependent DNA helicase RecG [Treponema sp.]
MFLNELTLPVTKLKGVGATAAEILGRLGINNLGDLLKHYPRGWEDRSRHVPLKDWESGPVCTEVKVLAADWIGFGRKKTLKIYIEDSSARACLVCFNRPFLGRLLKPGMHFRLYGNFSYRYGEIQSTAFDVAPVGGINEVIDPILPIYPLSLGMTQNMLRRLMRNAVEQFAPGLENEIPEPLIEKNDFFNKGDAIKSIHFPASMEDLEKARKTLIYEELFSLELMVLTRAMERKKISMEKTLQKDDFGNK